ncbi:MAG: AGE family epimerase/isomerase [Fimbriimonas sp.]
MNDLLLAASEIERSLHADLLDRWFPLCVSGQGGFDQEFARDWQAVGDGGRSIVFQSRMTWVAATMAEAGDAAYAEYARHGLRILADRFIDESGAVRWSLADDPEAVQRHAYGHSFALYALAAVARALRSEEALALAQSVFGYLEASHYDPEFGGYFEVTDLEGRPVLTGEGKDAIGTPYGWKSQNTHLHLLEAYAELYRAWPDARVAKRLEELLGFFLRELYVPDGWLHVYVKRDWQPIAGPVSHGHDVEAAHLILDAARTLGRLDAEVRRVSLSLIDYAMRTGWHAAGGFFYTGSPGGDIVDDTKNWWAQAEGLLGLAAVYDLTHDRRYADALLLQWRWIRDRQIDPVHGGWYESVAPDGTVRPPLAKGHAWKAAYHDGRALLVTLRLLRSGVLAQ